MLVLCVSTAAASACERPPRDDTRPGATSEPASTPAPVQPPGAMRVDTMPVPADTTGRAGSRVRIYFSRGDSAVAVVRQRAPGAEGLAAALGELLRGPTQSERAAGLHSWFSDTTAGSLRSASVDDGGRAVVDFADLSELIPNASTSAGSAMLLRELNATVFSVPAVQSVEYRMEGSCARFWEWLQYTCEVVQRPS